MSIFKCGELFAVSFALLFSSVSTADARETTVSTVISAGTELGLEQGSFLQIGKESFMTYFRRYKPQVESETEKEIICKAQYGKYLIKSRFYEEDGKMKISLTTEFDRDRIKWFNNIVKRIRNSKR